ncbi:MAG: HAD hydrolase family protein [Oscillospiraceae bacterium]|jgi:Cof subfamily protein (haloacid dehalogenase superfamily)
MNIRAILLDFDGTALQRDQVYISYRNKQALMAAMEKGIQIIPSTGRVEDMFPPQIEADKRIRYWVTANGARVVDRQTKEVIYQSLFTPEESAQVCRLYEGQKIYSEISANGLIYMEKEICQDLGSYPVPPHHVWFLEEGRQVELDKPSEFFLNEKIGIEKINIYGVPEEKQQPLLKALEDTGFVEITPGAGKDIQFFPKRLDRAKALEALFERLGIGYENVMALGDSVLDLPSIERAAIGVAMDNAPDSVKKVADFVTAPFDQDGVAIAIEKYLL